jgi:hypothetical protein
LQLGDFIFSESEKKKIVIFGGIFSIFWIKKNSN